MKHCMHFNTYSNHCMYCPVSIYTVIIACTIEIDCHVSIQASIIGCTIKIECPVSIHAVIIVCTIKKFNDKLPCFNINSKHCIAVIKIDCHVSIYTANIVCTIMTNCHVSIHVAIIVHECSIKINFSVSNFLQENMQQTLDAL